MHHVKSTVSVVTELLAVKATIYFCVSQRFDPLLQDETWGQ